VTFRVKTRLKMNSGCSLDSVSVNGTWVAYRDGMGLRRALRMTASLGVVTAVLLGQLAIAGTTPDPSPTSRPEVVQAGAHRQGAVAASASTRLSFRLPTVGGQRYTPNARNIAMRTAVGGPLLLFLPATGAVPGNYRSFLDTAQSVGYHVLALDYWNLGRSVAQTCGTDPGCYGDVQANRFDGSHATRYSAIAKSDSIVNRLRHALRLLEVRDPHGQWGDYLSGDRVRWDRVVLAGHSQGGGESAYIAHQYQVNGVLLFASPVATDGTVVASWLTRAGRTPSSRYYGFDARGDVYFSRIQGSWTALKIGGAVTAKTVATSVPIGGSHRLVTDVALGTPGQAHSRMISDSGPRTSAGVPVFRPIWLWMLKAVRASSLVS
jgi:hypothetical protein